MTDIMKEIHKLLGEFIMNHHEQPNLVMLPRSRYEDLRKEAAMWGALPMPRATGMDIMFRKETVMGMQIVVVDDKYPMRVALVHDL